MYYTPSELALMSPDEQRMAMLDQAMTGGVQAPAQIYQQPQAPQQGGGALSTAAGVGSYEALDSLIGGSGAADAAGGVILSPGSSAVASAAPWASEGVILNPATGEAVASAVPTAAATAAPSMWSLGGFGSAGNVYAPALGAMLAGDVLINKKHGAGGAAEGALAGAGIGSTFGGLPGAAIGAGLGGLIGYFGNFGDKDRYLTEYNRAKALRDKGVNWDLSTEKPSAGVSIDDLIATENAKMAAGQYGNTTFAASRNEGDLKPEDIWGYSTFGEKFGNDWLKGMSEDQRRKIAQAALDQNAVREHTGTVDVNWTPELDKLIEDIRNPKPQELKK